MNYLDKTGVTYLWNKIKNYIANRIVPVSGGVLEQQVKNKL